MRLVGECPLGRKRMVLHEVGGFTSVEGRGWYCMRLAGSLAWKEEDGTACFNGVEFIPWNIKQLRSGWDLSKGLAHSQHPP